MTRSLVTASLLTLAALHATSAQAELMVIQNVGFPARDNSAPYTLTLRVGNAVLSHTIEEADQLQGISHRWEPGDAGFDAFVAELTDDQLDETAVGLSGSEHTWPNENWGNQLVNTVGWDYVGMGYDWTGFEAEVRYVWPDDVSLYWRAWASDGSVPEPAGLGLLAVACALPWRRRR